MDGKQPSAPRWEDAEAATVGTARTPEPAAIGTACTPERATIGTAERDADAASIVTIDDEEGDALSGDEILYRLRLAHIHGK